MPPKHGAPSPLGLLTVSSSLVCHECSQGGLLVEISQVSPLWVGSLERRPVRGEVMVPGMAKVPVERLFSPSPNRGHQGKILWVPWAAWASVGWRPAWLTLKEG